MSKLRPTPYPIRAYRCLRLALHMAWIGLGTALAFRFLDIDRRIALQRRWSRKILSILAVRVEALEPASRPGRLIVANHVSWLDIFAINAVCPSAFVSKAELREWPFVGWLAERYNTIFLRRGSRGHARIVNGQINAWLNSSQDVAIFPEGTTSDGHGIRRFLSSLLQPAVELNCPIVPAALRYRTLDGAYSGTPAYIDDISMWQSLKNIVSEPGLIAELHFGEPIVPNGHRRDLAAQAEQAVARILGVSPARGTPPDARLLGGHGAASKGTAPQTPVDPPA